MARLALQSVPSRSRVDVLQGPIVDDHEPDARYECGGCSEPVLTGRNVEDYLGRFAIACPCGALNQTAVAPEPDCRDARRFSRR